MKEETFENLRETLENLREKLFEQIKKKTRITKQLDELLMP
jgi:hypothetical protein